jgi:four helix bundle protein
VAGASKCQVTSSKYQEPQPKQPRDLVERTFALAQAVRAFVNESPRTVANYADIKQLVRASGSVAANYLESQEGLSRKDFFFRIRICRKEAREASLWLRLVDVGSEPKAAQRRAGLTEEAEQLKRIFSAIVSRDVR